MDIPSRVWIKNDLYEVVYTHLVDKPDDMGYCDDKKKILFLKLALSEQDTLDTFIHETLHAICHKHKIRIGHTTLDKLSTAIAETILLNKP